MSVNQQGTTRTTRTSLLVSTERQMIQEKRMSRRSTGSIGCTTPKETTARLCSTRKPESPLPSSVQKMRSFYDKYDGKQKSHLLQAAKYFTEAEPKSGSLLLSRRSISIKEPRPLVTSIPYIITERQARSIIDWNSKSDEEKSEYLRECEEKNKEILEKVKASGSESANPRASRIPIPIKESKPPTIQGFSPEVTHLISSILRKFKAIDESESTPALLSEDVKILECVESTKL